MKVLLSVPDSRPGQSQCQVYKAGVIVLARWECPDSPTSNDQKIVPVSRPIIHVEKMMVQMEFEFSPLTGLKQERLC